MQNKSDDVVKISIEASVNGEWVSSSVEPRTSVADFLRSELELTGTHLGCEHGECGACTVMVDGVIVRGCLMLAVQVDGSDVLTIEGAAESGLIEDLQEAFHQRNALQCGFCTPGMLLTASELLNGNKAPSREEIRQYLAGNYCRCTGYEAIVDAIEIVAQARSNNTVKQQ